MKIELHKQMVIDLWDHMSEKFDSCVANKEDSDFMQLISEVLDGMGILDKDYFLEHYATTIRTTIYVPFDIGDDINGRSLFSQALLCAHENMHVQQWHEGGEGFAAEYIASSSRRAFYEAQAMISDFEVYYWLTNKLPDPTQRAIGLRSYGCREADIKTVSKHLRIASKAIEMGNISTPTAECVIDFLENYDG